MEHCHQNGIVHRDLKLENILITKSGDIKLADFGFSGSSLEEFSNKKGTFAYMAPEIYNYKKESYKGVPTDVFALGVILFTMMAAEFPFSKAIFPDKKYKCLHRTPE